MVQDVRLTTTTLVVLRAFLDAGPEPRYGLEIAKGVGIKSGSLHPALDRLERAGWLVGE